MKLNPTLLEKFKRNIDNFGMYEVEDDTALQELVSKPAGRLNPIHLFIVILTKAQVNLNKQQLEMVYNYHFLTKDKELKTFGFTKKDIREIKNKFEFDIKQRADKLTHFHAEKNKEA